MVVFSVGQISALVATILLVYVHSQEKTLFTTATPARGGGEGADGTVVQPLGLLFFSWDVQLHTPRLLCFRLKLTLRQVCTHCGLCLSWHPREFALIFRVPVTVKKILNKIKTYLRREEDEEEEEEEEKEEEEEEEEEEERRRHTDLD